MINCGKCQELKAVVSITTPDDLQQMLRLAQNRLAIGNLAENVLPQDAVESSQKPFSDLAVNGPWPDVIQYYFHCTACGQPFSLEVETYHGAGGTWSPLN